MFIKNIYIVCKRETIKFPTISYSAGLNIIKCKLFTITRQTHISINFECESQYLLNIVPLLEVNHLIIDIFKETSSRRGHPVASCPWLYWIIIYNWMLTVGSQVMDSQENTPLVLLAQVALENINRIFFTNSTKVILHQPMVS